MRIQNCLVTKHGITCFNEINKIKKINKIYKFNKINLDYILGYCLLKICERIIINSIDNFKLLNENLSYIDGVAFN
jgi:hypothetical protein